MTQDYAALGLAGEPDALEERLDRLAATVGPSRRWDLAQTLQRSLGKLLAHMDAEEGEHRLRLADGLTLAKWGVETWARVAAEKRRRAQRP